MGFRKHPEFVITADACILGALALLILPLRWIAAAVLAAGFHECCHVLALLICGHQIHGFTIGTGGAVLDTGPMDDRQEIFCALAGPAGSFLLVFLFGFFPELGVCALIQGIYNLLPIYPLDGGRVVSGILSLYGIEKREFIMKHIRSAVIFLLLIAGLAGLFFWKLGIGVLIPGMLLIQRGMERKIPCKDAHKRVQ